MRILLAPNAFKGTFSPVRVTAVWEAALRGLPDVTALSRPLSDGGDGALEVWEALLPAPMRVWFIARDPLENPGRVPVLWNSTDGAGFVESALASGLALVPPGSRNPLAATTFGCGQLLLGLLELGAREVTIGLGGSATCDGGLGLARALGYEFRGAGGGEVRVPADLPSLSRILPPAERPWEGVHVRALCDVRNPLLGPAGAARVFAPQKFDPDAPVAPASIQTLERGLARLAERARVDLGVDMAELAERPGAGAAGGLGLGLAVFAGAALESGSAHFLGLAGVPDLLEADGADRVDLVLTGEGSYDAQSSEGKVTGELRELCRTHGVPLAVVAGRGRAAAGELVLTAETIGVTERELDEAALAALAVQAVGLVRRLGVAGLQGAS